MFPLGTSRVCLCATLAPLQVESSTGGVGLPFIHRLARRRAPRRLGFDAHAMRQLILPYSARTNVRRGARVESHPSGTPPEPCRSRSPTCSRASADSARPWGLWAANAGSHPTSIGAPVWPTSGTGALWWMRAPEAPADGSDRDSSIPLQQRIEWRPAGAAGSVSLDSPLQGNG